LSECHKSFLHNQTFNEARADSSTAEYLLPTCEAVNFSVNETVRGFSVEQHHFTEVSQVNYTKQFETYLL